MKLRPNVVVACLLLPATLLGCGHAPRAAATSLADPRDVAAALGDPPPGERGAITGLLQLAPPEHARSCCAFGMDLEVDFAGMEVPFFEVSNVVEPRELGTHAYTLPLGAPDSEKNGLVYTCRGGWIDTAHVRENADITLFLALRIAEHLEAGSRIEIPGHGAPTTIVVAPVSADRIAREGALQIAATLAAWTTYRISIWHEVATWYGYQSVSGFSEQPSAFSLEDLYSNVLGTKLALAAFGARRFEDEDDYDVVVGAFIEEGLARLDARTVETSREIMASLDGRWWDSNQRLPDNHLVRRRFFPPDGSEIRPWRAEDAFASGSVPEPLASACADSETRPLTIASRVGRTPARELVTITFAPEGWADERFPFRDPAHRVVEERDLDRLTSEVHAALAADLGPGFDRPGPS